MAKLSDDAARYYAGGVRHKMGGVPVRLARLPIGPAGRAMLAQSSREMVYPAPPRGKREFAKWELAQLHAFKAAEKLGDRSIGDVVSPMRSMASAQPIECVEVVAAVEASASNEASRPAASVVTTRYRKMMTSPRSPIRSGAMRAVIYMRVSTERQGRSGLGLDAQRAAVEAFCASRGCEVLGEFVEVESGKRDDRPELEAALRHAKMTGATLVIAKLDRLSRNVAFLAQLQDAGVRFVAADMPDANELTIHIMAAMAQHERKAISARTKAALAQAKERGTRLGNPMGAEAFQGRQKEGAQAAATVHRASAQAYAEEVRPIIDDIRAQGLTSLGQIATELDRRGIVPPRGDSWSKMTVSRIIGRTSDA
jgi:DNA invertase Pin-like site-specific DNA recombinase